MTDTEKLIKTLDARYAAGQIGFQEGVSALANHDALKTAQRLALALQAIEAAKELIADEAWYVDELGEYCLGCCLNKKLGRHTSTCPISRFLEAVTKLEQSK